MAKFLRITLNPNRVRIVVMLLIFVLASAVLFLNTGMRNAFYQTTWIVKLPTSATEEYVSSFSSSPYLASLDKQNKELHWQGIPQDELNRKLDEIRTQFKDEAVSVSEVTELLPPSLAPRVIYSAILVLVVSLVYLYFVELGNFNLRKIFFRVTGLNIIALAWAIVVMLGILSSMSLIYKLTIYSFLVLVIMLIWAGVGYYRSLGYFQKTLVLESALIGQRDSWRQFSRSTWNWLAVFIVLLSLSSGTVFVVDGILLGIGIVLVSYAQQELPILVYLFAQRVSRLRFYKTAPKFKKPEEPKPSVKAKSKKSKKSKRKI